ncbi:Uncharacterized protein dnm_038780 [Desulfonema magnum]|uniref:Uncharacterized protein n=1 Tax=Desulfonema magnum TaxID=45655 RepID=A0A975BLS9_9BACT|nr:Uncharacterized protein dnm_038780 [Desulfonema magnum]
MKKIKTSKLFLKISTCATVFYISFFCELRRNPAFSFTGGGSFREKSRVSSRVNIKNFCSGTYLNFSISFFGVQSNYPW